MSQSKFRKLKEYFQKFSAEQIDELNQREWSEAQKDYKDFTNSFQEGYCYICSKSLNTFDESKFCYHWFLYPNGIKKKHFEKHLRKPISFFSLQSYLRWCANLSEKFVNINDLSNESREGKMYELTIIHKNIEWSISISESDYNGHIGKGYGAKPHYHFQMYVDSKPFICFRDFHIQFTDQDLFNIEAMKQMGEKYTIENNFGAGMSFFERERNVEKYIDQMKRVDNEDEAMFHVQTIVYSIDDHGISVDLIRSAFQESKSTGKTIANVLREMNINAQITCIMTPSKTVPKMKSRLGGRK